MPTWKPAAETFDLLHHPLLPYQREGMLRGAFGRRALLAGGMGLGKTIQAIAAAELLRKLRSGWRVLVVCPASLKGEWEEQIARFSGAETKLVNGSRRARLFQYDHPAFFTVVKLRAGRRRGRRHQPARPARHRHPGRGAAHQELADQDRARGEVACRALRFRADRHTVGRDRIDEVCSIVQFLDPGLLGPLFRFNRDFYELDERGRPTNYKSLQDLKNRLAPVMVRRRKRDVETELPGRTVTTFVVPMHDEQRARYEDYHGQAARLIAARRNADP